MEADKWYLSRIDGKQSGFGEGFPNRVSVQLGVDRRGNPRALIVSCQIHAESSTLTRGLQCSVVLLPSPATDVMSTDAGAGKAAVFRHRLLRKRCSNSVVNAICGKTGCIRSAAHGDPTGLSEPAWRPESHLDKSISTSRDGSFLGCAARRYVGCSDRQRSAQHGARAVER